MPDAAVWYWIKLQVTRCRKKKKDFYSVIKDEASKLLDLPFTAHLLVASINNASADP